MTKTFSIFIATLMILTAGCNESPNGKPNENLPTMTSAFYFKDCSRVKAKSSISYIAEVGNNAILRCENEEVVCYIGVGDSNDNLQCKWKENFI